MTKAHVPFRDENFVLATSEINRGEISGALIGVVRNIRALNNMLACANREQGYSSDDCEGMYDLFSQQAQILAAATNIVYGWEAERRAEAQAEAAERKGAAEAVREVREAFIVATAKAGTEPQIIAQALNMRRSSIEHVIGQLRGGAPLAPEASRTASA